MHGRPPMKGKLLRAKKAPTWRILIQRLADIGVRDKALEWFRSYLVDQTTSVKVNNSRSCCSLVKYGVPQGSVLGPTLFNVYCRPLGRIIRKHDISYHMYADDSQLYVDFSPCDEKTALANLQLAVHSRSKRMVERKFLTVK